MTNTIRQNCVFLLKNYRVGRVGGLFIKTVGDQYNLSPASHRLARATKFSRCDLRPVIQVMAQVAKAAKFCGAWCVRFFFPIDLTWASAHFLRHRSVFKTVPQLRNQAQICCGEHTQVVADEGRISGKNLVYLLHALKDGTLIFTMLKNREVRTRRINCDLTFNQTV